VAGWQSPPGGGPPVQPTDPPVENTIGFFLDGWQPKNFQVPAYTDTAKPTASTDVFVTIDASKIITKVPGPVFGQNANIWMSQMVTEPSLMNNIKNLKPNVIRFPGGSNSDLFFWNAVANQKPADAPANLLDANGVSSPVTYWFGKNSASWTMSVDNFIACFNKPEMRVSSPSIMDTRYGTGSNPVAQAAHLAADWVRFDNGRTRYWEIGNECNGTWEAGYRINTATNQDGQPEIVTGAPIWSTCESFC
jgi:hypothetical protein